MGWVGWGEVGCHHVCAGAGWWGAVKAGSNVVLFSRSREAHTTPWHAATCPESMCKSCWAHCHHSARPHGSNSWQVEQHKEFPSHASTHPHKHHYHCTHAHPNTRAADQMCTHLLASSLALAASALAMLTPSACCASSGSVFHVCTGQSTGACVC